MSYDVNHDISLQLQSQKVGMRTACTEARRKFLFSKLSLQAPAAAETPNGQQRAALTRKCNLVSPLRDPGGQFSAKIAGHSPLQGLTLKQECTFHPITGQEAPATEVFVSENWWLKVLPSSAHVTCHGNGQCLHSSSRHGSF